MAIIIASQKDIDNYFESDEVNQSSLKKLAGGLDGYLAAIAKRKKDKEEGKADPEYFLIGGAVDTILTGEKGEFEKQYYVSQLDKLPSEAEIQIIGDVFMELVNNNVIDQVNFEDCYDAILASADEFGWQKNWKADTRVNKIIEKGTEYFEDLKNSLGLKILNTELKNKIDSILEWNKMQLEFIKKHQYFTKTAQKLREVNKNMQLQNIQNEIKKEMELEGFQSVVFQHENDHLNGVLFIDRVSEEEMELINSFIERKANGEKLLYVNGKIIEINFDFPIT